MCVIVDVRPSVETRLSRFCRSLLSGTFIGSRWRKGGWEYNRAPLRYICYDRTKLRSDPSVRETRRHTTSYPMNSVIVQPRAAESGGAGTTQLRRLRYYIQKFLLRSTSRLYLRILCIVSKTADVAASAGFSADRETCATSKMNSSQLQVLILNFNISRSIRHEF